MLLAVSVWVELYWPIDQMIIIPAEGRVYFRKYPFVNYLAPP